ncbi:MAG: hypothetical protein ABIP13_03630 [Tepidiformaceae bacterium]
MRGADRGPDETDVGALVLLPGGEVAVLLAWWNAADGNEWRWQVEPGRPRTVNWRAVRSHRR